MGTACLSCLCSPEKSRWDQSRLMILQVKSCTPYCSVAPIVEPLMVCAWYTYDGGILPTKHQKFKPALHKALLHCNVSYIFKARLSGLALKGSHFSVRGSDFIATTFAVPQCLRLYNFMAAICFVSRCLCPNHALFYVIIQNMDATICIVCIYLHSYPLFQIFVVLHIPFGLCH